MENTVSDVKTEEATPIDAAPVDMAADTSVEGDSAVAVKKPKKPINQQKLQDNIWGWAFCAPLIIGTCVFVFFAFVVAVILSFTGYRGDGSYSGTLFDYVFGGGLSPALDDAGNTSPFRWYIQMVTTVAPTDGSIKVVEGLATWRTLFNAVFYMIGIPIGMIISMVFAVLMSRDIKGGGVFRVLYYVPVISSTVAISYTFRNLFQTQGVINSLFHTQLPWLAPAQMAEDVNLNWFLRGLIMKTPILVMCIWKGLGGTIVLFCAGLSGVNAATKEAASIDGANSWQIFWKVTMPDLYPTIFYTIVTSVIGGMQIYAEPQLLYNQGAGITHEVDGFVAMIWYYGLQSANSYNYAYGCALGMLLFVIILILTLIQFYMDSKNKD